MIYSKEAFRFLSSVLLIAPVALGGCVAGSAESGDTAQIETATEALKGSSITLTERLVGSWKDSENAYPTLELKDDGSYSLNTGIVCITEPCPSGEEGSYSVSRSGSKYYMALMSTEDNISWYTVRLENGEPARLQGSFGTGGSFVRQPYCVEWESADEQGNPLHAFYAENVRTYEEGKARLAELGPYFIKEAIRAGSCEAQPKWCTKIYAPVCGQVFDDSQTNYGNLCGLKVDVRSAAGTNGDAKGRWSEGECNAAPVGLACGGYDGLACAGLSRCIDDANDGCDPQAGGADCGGVCVCDALAKCAEGHVFDSSPEVCTCVPEEQPITPCALVRCGWGTTCEVIDGAPQCVSDGNQACGNATCAEGTVCCNASCGICTPPDGACIQIACADPN